jgi:hypothetical protein
LEVYPNPAVGAFHVAVTLQRATTVRVIAYDPLGRAVRVLHDGHVRAGEWTFTFDDVGLPGGVYVVRAEGRGLDLSAVVTVVR